MADVKALAEGLVGLTVKEVQELADFLKSEDGIEPAAAAVVVSAGGDGGAHCRAGSHDFCTNDHGDEDRAGHRRQRRLLAFFF